MINPALTQSKSADGSKDIFDASKWPLDKCLMLKMKAEIFC